MTLSPTDRTKLSALDPNLVNGVTADPALRYAVFHELYVYLDSIIADGNAAQGAGAVTTTKLADGSVVTVKLADLGVTTGKVADGAIVTAKLSDGSVTTLKIADGSITTAKLANQSVTIDKLSPDIQNSTNLEVVNARVSVPSNMTYTTLKARLDDEIGNLSQIAYLPKDFTQAELKNALLNVPDGGLLKLPKGTYVFNDFVDREFTQGITIIGEKGTIIDATVNTNTNLFNFHGSRGASAALATDATQYNNSIQTTLAVSPGDILLITSTDLWNPARSYYYKGEMVEVDSVSGTTVTIRGFLADSYTAATTTVYKLNAPKIIIKDITIKRNSNHMGLYVQYARNVVLENVSVSGARERCLWVDYCFGGEINNCYVSDCWYSGSSTSYGLAITSCQNINVNGGKYLGGRHGLSITGAEPNRHINIYGATVGNYVTSGSPHGFDCHGNTEFINVRGCTVLNGLLFNGTSYTISNNRIIGSINVNAGLAVQTECPNKNGYLVIENNNVVALATSSTGIDVEAIVPNVTYKEITIRNNIVQSNTQGISLNPHDTTCTGFSIEYAIIEDNDVSCNTAYALLITNNGTTYTHIDKLSIRGGKYVSTAKRALVVSLDATSDIEIKEAVLISNDSANFAIVVSNGRDVTFNSCYIKGLNASPYSVYNQFNCAGVLKLINNKFENFSANKGIRYDGTPAPTMAILNDNTFTNCAGSIFKGSMPTYNYLDQDGIGVIISKGTAAPTSTPTFVGQHFVDTTNKKVYVATGTASSADWSLLN